MRLSIVVEGVPAVFGGRADFVPQYQLVELWKNVQLYISPDDLNEQIREFAEEATNDLILSLIRARDKAG